VKRLKAVGAAALAEHIPRQGSPTNPYLAGAEIIVGDHSGDQANSALDNEEEEFASEGIKSNWPRYIDHWLMSYSGHFITR
jgi:hypothetical protein